MKRWLLATVCLFVLGGCSWYNSPPQPRIKSNESYTIKVMYYDDQSFLNRFGKSFMLKYPNIELNVIPFPTVYPNQDIVKIVSASIQDNQPDVLFLPNLTLYYSLANSGALIKLDPLLKRDKVDLSLWAPSVISVLKQNKQNAVYGITPTYSIQGLYYNKDLFDKYGVPHPNNQMTWEETTKLAQQFPSNEIIGLLLPFDYPIDLATEIGAIRKEPMWNAKEARSNLSSAVWQQIWNMSTDFFRSRSVHLASEYPKSGANPFLSGKAAMYLNSNGYISDLEKENDFTWGVVTEPVVKGFERYSYSISLTELFALNSALAGSNQSEASWELLKFIQSEELAKNLRQTSDNELLLQKKIFLQDRKIDLSAFYKLSEWASPPQELVPPSFFTSLHPLADKQFKMVIEGTTSAEEALRQLDIDAEQIYRKAQGQ